MSRSLFSHHWYRIASIKPRLKKHVEIHRHVYRGQVWYVLQNHISGKFHRFTWAAYVLIEKMNGELSTQSIWEYAVESLGEKTPSQDEIIALLGQLHSAGALASDVPPDVLEMFHRAQKESKQKWMQRLISPMAIRIPLIDPDKWLTKFVHLVRPAFGVTGGLVWLTIACMALVAAAIHWEELTQSTSSEILGPGNLLMLALLFPLIKALHELGHALATKAWGGEVHEMGVMLLVFMPVPYVDASASSAFREPLRRLIVGAAGMMVEVLIAAIALFYWLHAEPGVAKALAYNILLITGVSTLLFNANPLLRFDGYYMLADLLQIPNLAQRSNRYFVYLLQKFVLGLDDVRSPVSAQGERRWFLFYSIGSFIYRAFIAVVIAMFVAKAFFFIGVMLAIWSLSAMFVLPVLKGFKFFLTSPRVHRKPVRAGVVGVSLLGAIGFLLLMFPQPRWTNAEGVIWMPENSIVRAGTDCFVKKVLVRPGTWVEKGRPLVLCEDSLLAKDIVVLEAKVREQEVAFYQAMQNNMVEAAVNKQELESVRESLERARERVKDLIIRSQAVGKFVVPLAQDLPGMFIKQGQEVAYIIQDENALVRVVVDQADVGNVRANTTRVELRSVSDVSTVYEGRIKRHIPGGSEHLPSAVLGSAGGGDIGVDPRHADGLTTFRKVFQFDIEMLPGVTPSVYEERVYLRFYHTPQSLGAQWLRHLRLMLMEEFGV